MPNPAVSESIVERRKRPIVLLPAVSRLHNPDTNYRRK